MAWIKVMTTLPRSAKLMAFAQVLRMKRREALGVNDRVLDCAGIHRVKDRVQDGTVLSRFMAD